jgi:CheY-like chemotaxis protein
MEFDKVVGKQILVVDDEPEVRRSIRMLLEVDHHTVVEAASGAEALKHFEDGQFDLVATDYAMPGMRGDELARRIKERSPAQPILLITGSPGVFEATARPVDAVLFKPFTFADLRRAIATLLSAPACKTEP